ncbi:MAG: hypothetical protein EOP20_06540 [Hyphomicrobiales bacterium]|nr:MAG: hypothetical protein EOP20_06540 [Hyphomicrobiales bacterium]
MSQTLSCACGKFHIELVGAPFITAECHCNSCREGSKRLASLPLSRSMTAENGGTPYVLYRKDRVRFPNGTGLLRGYRLSEKAPTRRVVTTCCNTPVFVEFNSGHWLSLYASLWQDAPAPAMQIRTQTGDVPAGTQLDSTLPTGGWATAGFYAKLLAVWIAMGFRVPKIEVAEAGQI